MSEALSMFLKENPIKSTTTLVTLLVTLVGGVILIDDRYAHAADTRQQVSVISSQLEINRLTSEIGVLTIRKSSLEDKIYDASAVMQQKRMSSSSTQQKQTAGVDMAIERYRNELILINDQIAKKNDLIDKLRTGK